MEQDLELMIGFKNGDKESFEKLVIKYRQSAINFSLRYVHDYYIAEDIAQESFASIYVYKDRYNLKYSFKTYLFTIIKNKSIDFIRKNREIPSDEKFPLVAVTNIENEILRKEEKDKVREKIKELNDEYKTAIYLIDFEDFSYKDTAKIMDKTMPQMKILIFRARKRLKILLEKEV